MTTRSYMHKATISDCIRNDKLGVVIAIGIIAILVWVIWERRSVESKGIITEESK